VELTHVKKALVLQQKAWHDCIANITFSKQQITNHNFLYNVQFIPKNNILWHIPIKENYLQCQCKH